MVHFSGTTSTPVAADTELNVVLFDSTDLSNRRGAADEEYYRIAQALIEEKYGLELILKELPELARTLHEKAHKLKTRYNRSTGIVKYLDDLADELDKLPLYPAIRRMFVTSLRATQSQVSSIGYIPPENGWKFGFTRLSRADIMNLEIKLEQYLGEFLYATGWGEYIDYEKYLIDGKYCPLRAISFLSLLSNLSTGPISFSELPYSVAWIRFKPDLLKGDLLPHSRILTNVITSWSLIEYCQTTVNELSYFEALRTFRLYQTKGESTSILPSSIFSFWAQDFYRYMNPSDLTTSQYVALIMEHLKQLNRNLDKSHVPSIDYLEAWFTRVAPDSVLSTPRITQENFYDQAAYTSSVTSANGKKRNKQTARCESKIQKVHTAGRLSKRTKTPGPSTSTPYVYLPRGPGIRYSKPPKFLGKTNHIWCMDCGFDHSDPNKHVFAKGKLNAKVMERESAGRLEAADRLIRALM